MKVLFVGLGSIGQRHLRNLKSVYPHELDIIALRSKKANLIIDSDMSVDSSKDLDSYYGIRSFYDLASVLKEKPDIAFITNPSSLHVPVAIELAKVGSHLFIEKPLSDSLDRVDELKKICVQNAVKVSVGFQMRFYPLLQQAWKLLKSGVIGNLLYARAKFGTYLPSHHPYEDYRISYAARQDLGGGVIMSLIHEIDYLYHLFGFPKEVVGFGGKLSELEMTVEDTVNIIINYENRFSANLILSFADRREERILQIVGDKGRIDLDFCRHYLDIYDADKDSSKRDRLKDFDRNSLFIDEMKHFISCIGNNSKIEVDLDEGIDSLRIAVAVKESINQKKIVRP